MDDRQGRRRMEIGQSAGGFRRDPQAGLPGERRNIVGCVKMMSKSVVGNVFVDQKRDWGFQTAAEDLDDVTVDDLGQNDDLVDELLYLCLVHDLGLLYGHLSFILEDPFVNSAVASLAQNPAVAVVIRGFLQLLGGEDHSSAGSISVGRDPLLQHEPSVLFEEVLSKQDHSSLLECPVSPTADDDHEHRGQADACIEIKIKKVVLKFNPMFCWY